MKNNYFIPWLLALSIVSVGFGTVAIGLIIGIHFDQPSPEPFSPFTDVLPGQPERAAEARGFVCPDKAHDFYHDLPENECILQPESGIFAMIRVMVSKNMIRETTFVIRDDRLRVGDLAVMLKASDFHVYRRGYAVSLSWNERLVLALMGSEVGTFSFFQRVRQVTFTNTRVSA